MKKILSLILGCMVLMTMLLPVGAEADEALLESVTRQAITMVSYNGATYTGEQLNLDFDGVTFTSSENAVIDPSTGVVTRPQQTKNVTLTASSGGATKEFSFRIPGLFEDYPVDSIVYYDDFEDGVLDSRIETTDASVADMEYDGKLDCRLGSKDFATAHTARIWLREDGKQVNGSSRLEFKIRRDYCYGDGYRVYLFGADSERNRTKAAEIDVLDAKIDSNYAGGYRTPIYIESQTSAQSGVGNTIVQLPTMGNNLVFAIDIDGETGRFDLSINGTLIEQTGRGYLENNLKGLACVAIAVPKDNAEVNPLLVDPWLEYFSCVEYKQASTEVPVYYDDFEDGVLDPRIELTAYSAFTSDTMEADGKLNFKGTGGAQSGRVWLKENRTQVNGNLHLEFKITRDYAYGVYRVYFQGLDSSGNRIKAAEIDVGAYDSVNWRSTLSIETGGADAASVTTNTAVDDPVNHRFVIDIDGETGRFDLSINETVINLNGTYLLNNFKGLACVSIFTAKNNDGSGRADTDPAMDYFSCTQPIDKTPVADLSLDYNAFDKKVTVLSPDAQDAVVIAAGYAYIDGCKTLVSVAPVAVTLVADGSVVADTSAFSVAGATSVILYLWNNLTELQPLTQPISVQGSLSTN